MSYPLFPHGYLGYPQWGGYAYRRQSGVVRKKMASGYTRNRLKYLGQPTITPALKFIFNHEKFGYFEKWVEQEIENGASQFVFGILTPGGVIDHTVKMTDDYQSAALPPHWQVSFPLEVESMWLPDDEVYEWFKSLDPEQQSAMGGIPRLEKLINSDIPDIDEDE